MGFNTPYEMISAGVQSGLYRLSLPWWNILLRGGMAGAYIGMGAVLMITVFTGVEPVLGEGIAQLLMGMVFPLGVILIVLTGAELFTGDAMLAPFAAFSHSTGWGSVVRLWCLSYIGNIIGALGFALLVTSGVFLQPSGGTLTVSQFGLSAVGFAAERCNYPGTQALISCFLKAIAAGWLINLAVLLAICADDAIGKICGIWFPVMAMTSTGFEHAITNACLIPAGLLSAEYLTNIQVADIGPQVAMLSWSDAIIRNIIPSTIGNLIGGLIFAGLLLWIAFRREISR
jgi:formate transporter